MKGPWNKNKIARENLGGGQENVNFAKKWGNIKWEYEY